MATTKQLIVVALTALLFARAAYSTNGYMSHGYGIASKGMAGGRRGVLPQD
jgi:hypothetical protein